MDAALLGVAPRKSTKIAQRFTVPGALTSAVATYEYNKSLDRQQMMDVAKTAFEREYQNALTNPYHVIEATDIYNVGGLGDGEWADIVKVFVGEIGKGLGGRISGQNPYVTRPPDTLPPPQPTPMWVKAAVIGGGGLLAIFLIKSLAGR